MGLSFLALGDSYTIGEGVGESERWPEQAVRVLRAAGLEFDEPHVIARTGWTTDELAAAIAEAGIERTFDLVSLLIGVNNQYRSRPLDEYRAQFGSLLQTAVKFADGRPDHVIVVSIPDWGVTPFAKGRDREVIGREIDAFNAVNWEIAERAGAMWVDVTGISRKAEDRPELMAGDGLHPSGEMYGLWAEAVAPVVRRCLGVRQRPAQ